MSNPVSPTTPIARALGVPPCRRGWHALRHEGRGENDRGCCIAGWQVRPTDQCRTPFHQPRPSPGLWACHRATVLQAPGDGDGENFGQTRSRWEHCRERQVFSSGRLSVSGASVRGTKPGESGRKSLPDRYNAAPRDRVVTPVPIVLLAVATAADTGCGTVPPQHSQAPSCFDVER